MTVRSFVQTRKYSTEYADGSVSR